VMEPVAPQEAPLRPAERDEKAKLFEAETNAEAAKATAILNPPAAAAQPLLRKGWPPPEAMEAAKPTAEWLFQIIGSFTAGTRYEMTEARKAVLLEPTCGMIAKYAPTGAIPLELSFVLAAGFAFGQPLAQDLGLLKKPEAAAAEPEMAAAA